MEEKCPLCKKTLYTDVVHPVSLDGSGNSFSINTCPVCSMGITEPILSDEEMGQYYESTYRYDVHSYIESEKRWRSRKLIKQIKLENVHSILDIGCMYGYLLEEAKKLGISRCDGIEPYASQIDYSESIDHMFNESVESYQQSSPLHYDLVIAQHVLEHVRDISSFASSIYQMLRPGGYCILCVPNYGSLTRKMFKSSWGWYQVPMHRHHFTEKALLKLCQESGFSDFRIKYFGGDSIFILTTLFQALSGGGSGAPGHIGKSRKFILKLASLVLRPYYFIGSEELCVIMRKQDGDYSNNNNVKHDRTFMKETIIL